MTIELAGETIVLRADRSLVWPTRKTLVIADPHFGKADAFRAAGVPVPGSGTVTLNRLATALLETAAERLIVLGDFWHSRDGRTAQVLDALHTWRQEHSALHIDLLRGNHDRAGPPPANWASDWKRDPILETPFVFQHDPEVSGHGFIVAGHIHPGVVLHGRGRQRLRLPAFWITPYTAVLPAFGSLTGLATSPPDTARCFAIADDSVCETPRYHGS